MATQKIGNRTTTFMPETEDTTYLLAKGKVVNVTGAGIYQTSSLDDVTLDIRGRIQSTESGIVMGDGGDWASNLHIKIAESGRIDADGRGIDVYAMDHRIENDGKISGFYGIRSSGANGVIDNAGEIISESSGMVVVGPHRIVNSGTIEGGQYGIVAGATEDGGLTLKNTGTIEGSFWAVQGTSTGDRIVNSGTLKGGLELNGGEDTFVFKGGKITGEVAGGMDGDRYIIHAKGVDILETSTGGVDLVKASVSFTLSDYIEQLNLTGKANINGTGSDQDNHIQGNAGNNVLRGEGGVDFLLGMAGNDKLFGGDGADYFNFQKGSGKDIVMDFEAMVDEIQLGGLKGAKNFDDMVANHFEEKGADIWITYGKDVVVLKNTDAGEITVGDFVF